MASLIWWPPSSGGLPHLVLFIYHFRLLSITRCSQILECESRVFSSGDDDDDDDDVTAIFPKTSAYVSCVMERGELLLRTAVVTIVGGSSSPAVGRSASNIDKTHTGKGNKLVVLGMIRAILIQQCLHIHSVGCLSPEPEGMVTRSISAPHLQQPGCEHFVPGLEDLQRFRRWDQTLRNLHKTSRGSWSKHKECHVSVVEQIFTFVAGDPDEAVRITLICSSDKCICTQIIP